MQGARFSAYQDLPLSNTYAGNDALVCTNRQIQLQANAQADSFYWSQNVFLPNTTILQPFVSPGVTSSFILHAVNKSGCTEPVHDTVLVTVIDKVQAFAGNDTSLVFGQPLQLQAAGGNRYEWFPVTGLNSPLIANPIVSLPPGIDLMKYRVRAFISPDCFADDEIVIRYFEKPGIYIPSAFTPNGDGKNDYLLPVLPGIKTLKSFKIFNRWGQLAFSSKSIGKGWDGRINGQLQSTGVFVYIIEAVDFNNLPLRKTGSITLIR